MKSKKIFSACALALSIASAAIVSSQVTLAADHQEAPVTQSNLVADIGDYYAWHDSDTLNLVLTFGTLAAAGTPASYSSDILYAFHFDTSTPADGVSDVDVYAQFAQNADGEWGMLVTGLGDTPIVGPVESMATLEGISAYAGLTDDPFFFDLQGFNETINSGTLSFDPTRDSVAGLNVTSIVLQAPLSTVVGDVTAFQTWSTTGSL